TTVDGVRDGAQRFQAAPHGRALIADEMTPTTGAILLTIFAAAIGDRTGTGDEHDPAARRIAGVERGHRVVRHQTACARRRAPRAGRRSRWEWCSAARASGTSP